MNLPSVTLSYSHTLKASKLMLVTMLLLFGMAAMAQWTSGCALFSDLQAPNSKEQRYTARIVGCAATAKTKAEDHACRVAVNKEFGLCEGRGPFAGQMPGDCE